jgi:hypothetical protein
VLHKLIVYRLTVFNLIGVVLLGWATYLGWPQLINSGDSTHIVWVQAGLFAIGTVSLFWRAIKLAVLSHGEPGAAPNYDAFVERGQHLHEISQWLVILGLVGSVIGLAMTMAGIDPSALSTAAGAEDVISKLLDHMHVAFNTTIVGGILGLWAEVNFRILKTATVVFFKEDLVDYLFMERSED